jgi:hypothetical protein
VYQYNDGPKEIFSPEWHDRLSKWEEDFDLDTKAIYNEIAACRTNPTKLDLGLFFQAHSIPAFSLWHVLQACYELDYLICKASREEMMKWHSWRPFRYLLSDEIMGKWEDNLRSFSSEVERSTERHQKEDVATRLHKMEEAVQSLEEALLILRSVFESRRKDMECSYWMLELVQKSVDKRCLIINGGLDMLNK